LARLAYSKPVRALALAAEKLSGAYLVGPPDYAPPRDQGDTDPWGSVSVKITGYATRPTEAMQIADRIANALCRFIVGRTPRTLSGGRRFQPDPLPALPAKRVPNIPPHARRI
jgi:hypothetical protein